MNKWGIVMKSGKHQKKQTGNKQIFLLDLCWKVHARTQSFVCLFVCFLPSPLHMNYGTITFLLISSSVSSKQKLCFVNGLGQQINKKHCGVS